MQFLANVIAIIFSKRTEFDSINNDKSDELAAFWLANN